MSIRRSVVAAAVTTVLAVSGLVGLRPSGSPYYETSATRDVQYQIMPRILTPRWGSASTLPEEIGSARARLDRHRGMSYVLMPESGEWSRARNLENTLDVLSSRLQSGPEKRDWYVKALLDGYQERARKIDMNPAVAMNTPGTNAIDVVAGTVFKEFPSLQNWGIAACRNIAGTSSWSQHAYANAIDFGGSSSTLDDATYYMLSLVRKHYLPASQILWQGEEQISGSSVSDHYNHVHVSGLPLVSGPACQWGGAQIISEGEE